MSKPASYWRLRPFVYRLEGSRCVKCGHFHPLVRKVCRRCGSKNLERDRLPATGILRHFTVVSQAQQGMEKNTPFIVAWVEMDDGSKVVAQMTDCEPEDLKPAMKVETVVRKIKVDGESRLIFYGIKFRPSA
ncbi:MAG: Zn-ribbon domain-containing OB-fold protein [Candidatus Caldarchaeum sp.]|nr:Zn-ribbon domain-containing OB-fold protein [Candidatus Caldarchaeum sp.]MCS7133865.1 Zn-ribbon domain-containing OB-fold protein [Candidatus Caldarchaeum sp.]MCX8201559.1 Zn-ribbon domain-containing OB-fold protein [Candidatus Caldarchaeum sp.]MDW8063467.1 Zn-ribbon domain-containing OB-fold protein [Candidatus Caldarchaeum sp.]MDW8435493.1 Zn-ribbon domain-containing OB-fold protein [Candidatus Caldarchaeum sp.]